MKLLVVILLLLLLSRSSAESPVVLQPLTTPETKIFLDGNGGIKIYWLNVKGQAYYVDRSYDGGRTWEPAVLPESYPIVTKGRTIYFVAPKIAGSPDRIWRVRATRD